ncbi:MAG: DNA-3-methyladenine glycosylase 2 family protein [Gemmatimonadota bacterium]|nr:DNA-3-methyladenine glycosylase 2 family protein [Gemmatimonadota bacterium]
MTAASRSPADPRAALAHLRRADPVMAGVIRAVGPYRLRPRRGGSHFRHIVRAIVYQQLSGKAAGTIHARFAALFPRRHVEPERLLLLSEPELRAVGLSRQKIGYLRDLADKVHSGAVPLDRVRHMSDDAVIEHLVQVKGVGRWTAQMFLMFRLGRPDVLPDLDLGIQNAVQRAYGLRRRATPDDVRRIGAPWTPYRSVASWYLWRSLE